MIMIKTRRKLKNRLRKRNNQQTEINIKSKIRKLNKDIRLEIRKARSDKWTKICEEINSHKNPKKSWDHIKKIQGKKNKIPKKIIDEHNNIFVNKEEIANKFKERQENFFIPNNSNKEIFDELTKIWYNSNTFKQKKFKTHQRRSPGKTIKSKTQQITWDLRHNKQIIKNFKTSITRTTGKPFQRLPTSITLSILLQTSQNHNDTKKNKHQ